MNQIVLTSKELLKGVWNLLKFEKDSNENENRKVNVIFYSKEGVKKIEEAQKELQAETI